MVGNVSGETIGNHELAFVSRLAAGRLPAPRCTTIAILACFGCNRACGAASSGPDPTPLKQFARQWRRRAPGAPVLDRRAGAYR